MRLALCVVWLAACRREAPSESVATEAIHPVTVTLEKVVRGSIADVIETAGNLEPPPGMDAKLGSLAIGRLAELRFLEGDRVKAGQVLARIEAAPLNHSVIQAEATLKQARTQEEAAQAKLTRVTHLVREGIAARQEEEDARAQEAATAAAVHTAQAALSTAHSQQGRTLITAPFDGVIAHVFAALGEPVDGSGKPIIEITRTEVLELRAGLSGPQAMRVRPGQLADVWVEGAEEAFPGRVIALAPTIDPATGVAVVRLRLDNPQGILKGGAFARARLVANVHADALTVPKEALLSRTADDGRMVPMVLVADGGKTRQQVVEVGYTDGQRVEIRRGLQEGQSVVVAGAYALPDGTAIQTEPSIAEAPPADGGAAPTKGP